MMAALSLPMGLLAAALLLAGAAAQVPLPASMSSGSGVRQLGAELAFTVSSGDSEDLQAAVARYRSLIYAHGAPTSSRSSSHDAAASPLTTVEIAIKQIVKAMELGTDESYSLSVPAAGAVSIEANTTIGAYRALETLSQLVEFDFDAGSYAIGGIPRIIADRPRFAWRGLMIDTSRQ